MNLDRFHHVTKSEKCPVCDHDDWCLISNDGGTCICQRVQSAKPMVTTGGWIHVLKRIPPPVRRVRVLPPVRKRIFDAARAMNAFRMEWDEGRDPWEAPAELAGELGLSCVAVDMLEPGRSRFHQAWCFPMRDGTGKVVGIRLRRYGTSDKYSVSGSKDGLFYCPELEARDSIANGVRGREIVIVEGASDCAAGYEIGLPCVGRSSCATGAEDLKELCNRLKVSRVTIIADNDAYKARITYTAKGVPVRTMWQPGKEGAEKLARDLGRVYRIVTPPKKDLRDWVKAGCTAKTFTMVAELQKWRLPK